MNNPVSSDPQNNYLSDPDVLLMLDAQNGNMASFEALLRKYFGRILNFAYRYLEDRESAEDIAQETFICVHKSLATYRPKAKFQTWLYVIARNLCLNELRRRKRRPLSLDAITGGIDRDNPKRIKDCNSADPSAELEKNETCSMVIRAIETLPENQKTAVLLRRYQELTYEQIAEIMGCSLQAVKSLLNRAKENLRVQLSRLPD